MLKNHLRIGAVAILTLGMFMSACNKDDSGGPVVPSEQSRLTAHTWSLSGATLSDSAVTDSSFYTSCMADDSLNFKKDKSFKFSDGATTCDTTALPYGSGSWTLNAAKDTLSMKYSDTTLSWKIESLTDSTLQVSYPDSIGTKAFRKKVSFIAE